MKTHEFDKLYGQSAGLANFHIEGWHDPVYRAELEMIGQLRGLNYLKPYRGGDFVADPL